MKVASTRHQQGFTLIEILVVMVIIGILATISIGSFQSSQQKARDAQRKSDLTQVAHSLEAYYNDYDQYPVASINRILGCAGDVVCDWGDPFVDDNGTTYMVALPTDPKGQFTYYYVSTDGSSYQLYARLENTLDADVPVLTELPANYGIDCGDANCNYGISSPNITVSQGRTITAD